MLVAYARPALLVGLRGGERGEAVTSNRHTPLPLLLNIEHGPEQDAPLSCIAALPSYLACGYYIVITVEREIRNPQVRKDFPNG